MPKRYPRELRERAVRLVAEHRGDYESEYAAIAAKTEITRVWKDNYEVYGADKVCWLRSRG
jgi:transposase